MKKYVLYCGLVVLMLLAAACSPVREDSAGKPVGDPTGRALNTALSCVDHCSGYAAAGDEWCFCDAPCPQNGNCCNDFKSACPGLVK